MVHYRRQYSPNDGGIAAAPNMRTALHRSRQLRRQAGVRMQDGMKKFSRVCEPAITGCLSARVMPPAMLAGPVYTKVR
jgi:histidine ammonia-lyase